MSVFDCHLLIDLIVGMAENNDVNRSQAESLPMSLAKCKDSVTTRENSRRPVIGHGAMAKLWGVRFLMILVLKLFET